MCMKFEIRLGDQYTVEMLSRYQKLFMRSRNVTILILTLNFIQQI